MSSIPLPGPAPFPVVGNLPHVSGDALSFLTESARTWGDRVVWYAPGETIVQLTDPADIEHVLLREKDTVQKDPVTRSLDFVLGDGLLLSEGETWKRHRKLAAPSFKPTHLAAYGQAMVRSAQEDLPETGRVDVHDWMSRVTLHIVLRTLFGLEPGGLADRVAPLVAELMTDFDQEIHSLARIVPDWVPLPHRRRVYRAGAELDAVLREIVRDRLAAGPGDDLMWRLIEARTDDGQAMSETEIRDEAITLFLAGHETTSLALSYTLWLLSEHRDIQDRVHAELIDVLGDADPTPADLRRLPLTGAAIDEAMRLYSPAWTIGREVVTPFALPDGVELPAGTHILMPQWVVHRDGRWFPGPLRYHPDRWLNGETKDLPRFAYFPFGGGPRVCIGNHFAKMEAVLVLATVLRQFRFSAVPNWRPDLLPSVTLRPRHGVPIDVVRREAARAAA